MQRIPCLGRLLDSGYRMRVNVLFFGSLKEVTGRAQEDLEVPEGSQLAGVFEHYARRFPKLQDLSGSIVMARNHEFAPLTGGRNANSSPSASAAVS